MRRLVFAALLLIAVIAEGHVGVPDTFFNGHAGSYPVQIIVRTPGVVPGLAQISIRSDARDIRRVLVQPVKGDPKGSQQSVSPEPDAARPVPGEPGLWSGELWLMTRGGYCVNVIVEGSRGTARVLVPVNSVATQRLPMPGTLGIVLGVLCIVLVTGGISTMAGAARESTLPRGETPAASDVRRARVVAAVGFLTLVLLLLGGANMWRRIDRESRQRMSRPFAIESEATASGLLRIRLTDERWKPMGSLVPDHGKLMHLFLIDASHHRVFAHLHPVRTEILAFEVALPPIPPGRYELYADVTHESGYSQTLLDDVIVPPRGSAAAAREADPDDSWFDERRGGGTSIAWERSAAPIVVDGDAPLRFTLRGADGKPLPVEPYMGMRGHAVLRRDDRRVFAHLHPSGTISMAAQQRFLDRERIARPHDHSAHAASIEPVSFPWRFSEPGRYRLWVQIKSGGAVHTGVWDVDVTTSAAAARASAAGTRPAA